MKTVLFIVGAVVFIVGAYLLIDSALAISRLLPLVTDINTFPMVTGSDVSTLQTFTQALHEALLGIGAVLVAFVLAGSGFAIQLIQDRAAIEAQQQKELLAEQYPDKTPLV